MANLLIFDTENVIPTYPLVYDIGYAVIDAETGETLKEAHYLINQVYGDRLLFLSPYQQEKRKAYKKRIREGRARCLDWASACRLLSQDVHRYGVAQAFAYNAQTDVRAFEFTRKAFKSVANPFKGVEVRDILDTMGAIDLPGRETFGDFSKRFGFLSDKLQRPRKTAENVYRYITNNPDYRASHLSIDDVRIEKEILMTYLR